MGSFIGSSHERAEKRLFSSGITGSHLTFCIAKKKDEKKNEEQVSEVTQKIFTLSLRQRFTM